MDCFAYFKKLKSYAYNCNKTKMDVEKPEYESESFRVLVFRKLRIQVKQLVKVLGS